jgi:hypothetical protein
MEAIRSGGEQLVTDAAAGDRLGDFRRRVHCLDQIERSLRHAATLFGTGFKMLGRGHGAARRK